MAHACGRGGRVVLPLARKAAVSTGLRVRAAEQVEQRPRRELLRRELGGVHVTDWKISPYLPTSAHISPYLPISPHISLGARDR